MRIGRSDGARIAVLGLLTAVAAIPPLRMLALVRSGSPVQYTDYWPMTATFLRSGGGLDVGGLFEFRNEHPVVIAKSLYWLNIKVTGGSNIALGYVVIAIACLQVCVVAGLARRTPGLGRYERAGIVVASSALIFAPFGSWSFVKAMSGSAWLPANLFGLTAIWLHTTRGPRWSLPAGVLATVSYGTGLMVWPALVVTGWARDRRLRPQWPTVVTAAACIGWYLANFLQGKSSDNDRSGPITTLENTVRLVGSILAPSDPHLSSWLGTIAIVVTAGAGVASWMRHGPAVAPWLGLAAFAVGSAVLIGFGRPGGPFSSGVQSRYSSPAALVWLGALVLVITAVPRPTWAVAPLAVVALAATFAGDATVEQLRSTRPVQDQLAIAMQLDLADGSRRWSILQPFVPITDVLRSAHHYPFDGRWHADCGLLGRRLDADLTADPEDERLPGEVTANQPDPQVPNGIRLSGWIDASRPVECLLVIDGDGTVVGVGNTGYQPRDARRIGFRALAPSGTSDPSVVVRFEGASSFRRLPPA